LIKIIYRSYPDELDEEIPELLDDDEPDDEIPELLDDDEPDDEIPELLDDDEPDDEELELLEDEEPELEYSVSINEELSQFTLLQYVAVEPITSQLKTINTIKNFKIECIKLI
jgi:hypothetical protein